MLNEVLSAAILTVFVILLLIGAVTTTLRVLRYRRHKLRRPVLLGRDRDLLIGLAVPFLLIAVVRTFSLQWLVNDSSTGQAHIWWILVTGLPPIYALAVYDRYELFVIERLNPTSGEAETAIQLEDRTVGDERRRLQAQTADESDDER